MELSPLLRKDLSLVDFINTIASIINNGRYQMRVYASIPTHTGDQGEFGIYISGTMFRFYMYDDTNANWKFIEWNGSGVGQASVVASVALTGQGAAINATTIYTPSAAGTYRVNVYHLVTTAGGGTLTTTIGFTDDEGAKTVVPASDIDLSVDTSANTGTSFIRSTATAITYTVTIAGISGSPKFSLFIVLERLT